MSEENETEETELQEHWWVHPYDSPGTAAVYRAAMAMPEVDSKEGQ